MLGNQAIPSNGGYSNYTRCVNNITSSKAKVGGRKKPTSKERIAADNDLRNLINHWDYQSATELYLTSSWGHIRPKFFMSCSERKIRKLYDHETDRGERSWLYRLDLMQRYSLIDLCFVTVSAKMLSLSPENEDYRLFFDDGNIKTWQTALEDAFPGPLRWVLEAKPTTDIIHAHVLTDFRQVVNPNILEAASTKAVIPIRSTFALREKARYMQKQQLHFPTAKHPDRKQFEVYIQARQTLNRLPNTRGAKRIPKLTKVLEMIRQHSEPPPNRVVTPSVYSKARSLLTNHITCRDVTSKQLAYWYLRYYPDVPIETFSQTPSLSLDMDTLTTYIDFCRQEIEGIPTSKAEEKISTVFVTQNNAKRFHDYLHHPAKYHHNLKRRQKYRLRNLEFYEWAI